MRGPARLVFPSVWASAWPAWALAWLLWPAGLIAGCDDFGRFSQNRFGDGGPGSGDLTSGYDIAGMSGRWAEQPSHTSEDLMAVWGSSADDLWAVGAHGVILHRESGQNGGLWTVQTLKDVTVTLNAVWGTGPMDVFIAGDHGVIVHYVGGGAAGFSSETNADRKDLYGGAYGGVGTFAVGAAGAVYTRSFGNWNATPFVGGGDLYGAWASASDGFFVGQAGLVVKKGQGQEAMSESSGQAFDLRAVWGSGGVGAVLAVGTGGHVLRRGALGGWFSAVNTDEHDLRGLWGASRLDVYAVGDGGKVLHSVDDGATWKPEASGITTRLNGIWGSSASDIYLVGNGGKILHRVR